jgi:predicted nucleic acid-binding Zn ribbon protein
VLPMTHQRRWFDPLGEPTPDRMPSRALPPVGEGLRALAAQRGWQSHLAAGDLLAIWEQVVGPQLAGQTAPLRLQGGVLVLAASSSLWAAEVRLLTRMITERINERMGEGTVHQVTVSVRRPKHR